MTFVPFPTAEEFKNWRKREGTGRLTADVKRRMFMRKRIENKSDTARSDNPRESETGESAEAMHGFLQGEK